MLKEYKLQLVNILIGPKKTQETLGTKSPTLSLKLLKKTPIEIHNQIQSIKTNFFLKSKV